MNIIKKLFGLARKDEVKEDGNCWTINLVPNEFPNDESKWLVSTYIGELSKNEIEEMAWKDAIEQNVISNKNDWTIKVEHGIKLQWAD